MWGRVKANSTFWISLGLVLLSGAGFFLWKEGKKSKAELNLSSSRPEIKEKVKGSWEKRAFVNDSLKRDRMSWGDRTSSGEKPSPKAGARLQSAASKIQSPALKIVFGLEGDGKYKTRRQAISLLERPLPEKDQEWLYGFLASSEEVNGLSPSAQHALKDVLMVYLLNNDELIPETVEILRQIYLDTNQDDVIRNYAIQYLCAAFPKLEDGEQKTALLELLNTIANTPSAVGSGTALLGLQRLSEFDNSGVAAEDIQKAALNIAVNNNVPQMQRIHPLQICGQMKVQEAAPTARDLAVNGKHAMVRMAALATLGQLGEASDFALLQQASADPDERIRKAASVALVRFKGRLNQK